MNQRQQLFNIYESTLDKIDQDWENRIISDEEAEFARQNLVAEFNSAIAEAEGYTEEDFEPSFSDYLLALAEEEGYDDYEEFIYDLADTTGYAPEELDAIMTGQVDVPEEVMDDIVDSITDEVEEAEDIADELEESELDDEYLDDEYLDEEDYYDEEELVSPDELENYSGYYDDVAEFQQAHIDELTDKVQQMEYEKVISAEFSQREQIAREMVENGDLPPVAYNLLFGVQPGIDTVAAFSAVCEANEVDPATELYAMDKALQVIAACGLSELGIFQNFSMEVENAEFNEAIDAADYQAEINFRNRKRQKLGE